MSLKKTLVIFMISLISIANLHANEKTIAYIVSDITIPFWDIMKRGIEKNAKERGYTLEVYNSDNIKKNELINTVKAIRKNVAGLVISPIDSSSAVTILSLAKKESIPVVVADIGTDKGEYVSHISSNNKKGAYELGKVLARKMQELGWDKDGTVGIVAIPQKRANGKARTAGFMKAMDEAGIKGGGIRQQVDFSYEETYEHTADLIAKDKDLRAIWLQGSDKYKGALDAINDAGKKNEILLICFDAEPIFLELIPKGVLIGAAMQQPFLIGQKASNTLIDYLNGKKVLKNIQLDVLVISKNNIRENLEIIKTNVLGIK